VKAAWLNGWRWYEAKIGRANSAIMSRNPVEFGPKSGRIPVYVQ
jgi:hypothetical protein